MWMKNPENSVRHWALQAINFTYVKERAGCQSAPLSFLRKGDLIWNRNQMKGFYNFLKKSV